MRTVHYNVYFSLQENDTETLSQMRFWMQELIDQKKLLEGKILENQSKKSRLHQYHALFIFDGQQGLDQVLQDVRTNGIHEGLHGIIIKAVVDFHVEVFEVI